MRHDRRVTDVGATIGVEEEYHLVDAETMALADAPDVVPEAVAVLGGRAQGEISTSQLEVATSVLTSLGDVRAELGELRREADAAAQRHGCRILPTGTHPFATWHDQARTPDRRYDELEERFGLLALQQLITGTHVHVGVPDGELAVQVLDRLRPDLPVLLALSGSSPFWEGQDTAYTSFRTLWYSRFPVTGSQEVLRDRETYDRLVIDLVGSGVVRNASHLYWDARISTRFPTIEVRIADSCPHLDDVVLQAGLARSLVRTAAAAAAAGTAFPEPRPEVLRAARWCAARYGLEDRLLDLHAGGRRPAAEVVTGLLDRLRGDLEDAGEWDEVHALAQSALARGTSAAEQRRTYARTGDLAEVVRRVVRSALPG